MEKQQSQSRSDLCPLINIAREHFFIIYASFLLSNLGETRIINSKFARGGKLFILPEKQTIFK
jgi:hypothetical protein